LLKGKRWSTNAAAGIINQGWIRTLGAVTVRRRLRASVFIPGALVSVAVSVGWFFSPGGKWWRVRWFPSGSVKTAADTPGPAEEGSKPFTVRA
jgi:hypothetical protein